MSIYDKTGHIDQLTEWWDIAEEGVPKAGDTVIFDERHKGLGFHVTKAKVSHPHGYANARILARASIPWHSAVAVIADTLLCERQVWERESGGTYSGSAGDTADDYELRNVTPLIEAKVTDEMVERARDYMSDQTGQTHTRSAIRGVLSAALGIEDSNV